MRYLDEMRDRVSRTATPMYLGVHELTDEAL